MQFNYKGVIGLFAIGIALIVLLAFIVPGAHAEQMNGSYVEVSYPESPAPLNYIPRISQGDIIYINDTVDITGVSGWPGPDGEYRIAWYGRYTDSYSPGEADPAYILELPGKSRMAGSKSQYRFYVDPDVFYERTGYWYQFISNSSNLNGNEAAGNLRVFYVSSNYRTLTNASNNQTEFVYFPRNYGPNITPVVPLLPERHVTDYLVAKGDRLPFGYDGLRIWVFGREKGIYDKRDRVLSQEELSSLEVGTYKLVMQYPGKNTIYEATYSDETLIPGLYGKKPIPVRGMAAPVVHEKFKEMLADSDDEITTYNLVIEDPSLTINRADEIFVKGQPFLDIRGYTNVANGTDISVTLDEGQSYYKLIQNRLVHGTAVRTYPGNMSYWQVLMPIDYDHLAATAEMHTLTARTALGGFVVKDFKVTELPADSYRPNATVKYIEDRNPFVPTPTPIIQKEVVRVPGPERVVTVVTVITPDVSDYGRVVEGVVWAFVSSAALVGAGIVVLLILAWALTVWLRGRKE